MVDATGDLSGHPKEFGEALAHLRTVAHTASFEKHGGGKSGAVVAKASADNVVSMATLKGIKGQLAANSYTKAKNLFEAHKKQLNSDDRKEALKALDVGKVDMLNTIVSDAAYSLAYDPRNRNKSSAYLLYLSLIHI